MKILARYISSIFLKNFLVAVLGLSCLYLFQALLGELLNNNYAPSQVLLYNLLEFPEIMVRMAAPAVLTATVLTLSGLTRTNELIACYSIGVGLKQVMSIIFAIVFMICCLSLVFQDRILPPLFKKKTIYFWQEMKGRPDFFLDVKQDKVWYRSKNLIYNLRTFDIKDSTIYGMAVYSFDENFKLVQVVNAKKATYSPQGWTLKDGTVTVFSETDTFPLTKKFKEKDLQISETPKDFQEIEKEVNGLRIKELIRYIHKITETGVDTKSYWVQLHSRISLCFIPMVMCLLAVPFSVRAQREGGIAKDLGICLGITFFYWLFYSVGLSLGTNGSLPAWLAAWLPSVIFSLLAAAILFYKRS